MAKAFSRMTTNKTIKELLQHMEHMIPDKKVLKKYEALLEKKLHDLHAAERLDEILKPLRQKLEKSCIKPLEAKNLHDFSQRVMSVLRVQAKKKKKVIEKKLGKKFPKAKRAAPKKRRAPARKKASTATKSA
ncbi:MAG: hypothetical protein R3A80_12675 [Bdellovibrionota bacterium]